MKRKTEKKLVLATESFKTWRNWAIALIVVILAIGAGTFYANTHKAEAQTIDYSELLTELQEAGKEPAKRQEYLPAEMFAELPPFPEDFYEKRLFFWRSARGLSGGIPLSEITYEYYAQPELVPNWKDQCMPRIQEELEVLAQMEQCKNEYAIRKEELSKEIPTYTQEDHTLYCIKKTNIRQKIYGFDTFPDDQYVVMPQGTRTNVVFLLRAGCCATYFQGVQLTTVYPSSGKIFAEKWEQNPAITEKYIRQEFSPNVVLVAPAFPYYKWEEEKWTHKIALTVYVDKDTPPGRYMIAMKLEKPPAEQNDKWLKEYLTAYYSGSKIQLGRPWHNLYIEVTE